jgi:hypothetical protein
MSEETLTLRLADMAANARQSWNGSTATDGVLDRPHARVMTADSLAN